MRIGVNIPDDLVMRLEPLKPGLNLSQICRDAITSHVEKYEQAITQLETGPHQDALGKVHEEDARRRAVIDVDWEAKGYENAILWVQSAQLKDWTVFHKFRTILKRDNLHEWEIEPPIPGPDGQTVPCFDDLREEYYRRMFSQDDEFFDWMDENCIEMNWERAKTEYGRSWLAYIDAAWDIILRRREKDHHILQDERRAAQKSRPKPEVPVDQLLED